MHPQFEALRSRHIPSLKVTLEEYRHRGTGARHLHLAAEDDNNCFMVALPTVPQDSTGVAHILEHTTLCGSRRFPVRDPFFAMTRRSLYSFMNAFTSSDATAYPFATRNLRDFENLLAVYLDCVFFPLLDPLDFAQEGWRVEFEDPNDPRSPLTFKGVVYNEMKGAMSAPTTRLAQDLQTLLFPTTTYRHNCGGEPAVIPDLTHERLKAFHAAHYHPSNALFMTYGDVPAATHQERFQNLALGRFEAAPVDFSIPDERRYAAPVRAERSYAAEEGALRDRSHVVLAWLLGRTTDVAELMRAHVLSGVLLDHSASPLRHALETCGLGASPSPLCGIDDSTREVSFSAGLEGSNPESAEALEQRVIEVLEQVAREGVEPGDVEAVVQQLELQQREVGGGDFPYGLQLMGRCMGVAMHGGDPLAALDLDPLLDALREESRRADFVPGLTRRLLLDNAHRVRLTLKPDAGLAAREAAEERARLDRMARELGPREVEFVVRRAAELEARQHRQDDPEVLPSLGLGDVPSTERLPEGRRAPAGGLPGFWYAAGTNGLVYQQLVLRLPELDDAQRAALPAFWSYLTEVGCGEADYLDMQARQAAVGSVRAYASVRGRPEDPGQLDAWLVLAGKGLNRQQRPLAALLRELLEDARFDETGRLRELVAQSRAVAESSVTQHGHALASLAAASGIGPAAALDHAWDGLAGVRALKALDERLAAEPAAVEVLAATLTAIRDALREAELHVLLVGEDASLPALAETYAALWPEARPAGGEAFQSRFAPARVAEAWTTATAVNFCARAYPAVGAAHPDAAALMVLARFLHNGYLHRAIREQGGAYGSGASFDGDSGSFRFYSYRDPRLEETLSDFDRALDWLQSTRHDDRQRVEAVLGVVRSLDQPYTPASDAIRVHFGALHGRDAAFRRRLREQVLAVTLEDLRRVAAAWLAPERVSTVVLTDPSRLELCAALGLAPRAL